MNENDEYTKDTIKTLLESYSTKEALKIYFQGFFINNNKLKLSNDYESII